MMTLEKTTPATETPALYTSCIANAPDVPPPIFSHGPAPGGFGLVIGADGVGKGFFALDVLVSLVTGKPCAIPTLAPTRELNRVVYFCYEDDSRVLRWRLNRVCERAGVDPRTWQQLEAHGRLTFVTDAAPLFIARGMGAPMPTDEFRKMEAHLMAQHTDLLVIDPLSAAAILGSENDNAAMNAVACSLRSLADRTGCTILLTHHVAKHARHEGDHQAARGGSALGGAARWAMTLRQEKDCPTRLTAAVAKNSYGRRVFDIRLERDPETGVLREISGAELGAEKEAMQDAAVRWFAENAAATITLNAIRLRNTAAAQNLIDDVGAKPAAVHDAVEAAINDGRLATETRMKPNRTGTYKVVVFPPESKGDFADEDALF